MLHDACPPFAKQNELPACQVNLNYSLLLVFACLPFHLVAEKHQENSVFLASIHEPLQVGDQKLGPLSNRFV